MPPARVGNEAGDAMREYCEKTNRPAVQAGGMQGDNSTNMENSWHLSEDLGGGLFLIVLALLALWQGAGLDAGTLRAIGPGMLPRALAVMSGVCGVLIATRPWWSREPSAALGRWPFRGCLFVLGAALAFTFAIRPLGFIVAGPVAIVLAALGSRETRFVEIAIFALAMTVFCAVLFRYLLGLPIPIAPWLLGY